MEIVTQAYIRKRKVFKKLKMFRLYLNTRKLLLEKDRINEL